MMVLSLLWLTAAALAYALSVLFRKSSDRGRLYSPESFLEDSPDYCFVSTLSSFVIALGITSLISWGFDGF